MKLQLVEPTKPVQTVYLSCADTAKLIRAALREAFPSVTFSVKSKTYSGGASITVSWTDGPTSAEVDRVAGEFAGATFDGMTDCKNYHDSVYNGQRVHFGANFVFTNRNYSDALVQRAYARICQKWGQTPQADPWNDYRKTDANSYHAMRDELHRTISKMRPNGCIVTLKGN